VSKDSEKAIAVLVATGFGGVWLAVAEGFAVGRCVLLTGAMEVDVGGAVGITVEVKVGCLVAVALGVSEGGGVWVGGEVGVGLGDGVGVEVGVELGSGVSVAVGSGVGVDVTVAALDRGTGSVKVLPPLAERSSSLK
jgi:hypothetical protein